MQDFGKRLRKRRKEVGVTQERMAAQLMIHRTTYVRYERGQTEPPLETLCRMADVLDCSADWLLGRE